MQNINSAAGLKTSHADGRIGDLFAHYAETLHTEKLSQHTKRNYRTQAAEFVRYLSSQDLPMDMSADDGAKLLSDYRAMLSGQQCYSPGSITFKLKSAVRFLRFAGLASTATFATGEVDRTDKSIRGLTDTEMERVLAISQRMRSPLHRLLVLLFARVGLKKNEALNLRWSDIKASDDKVYINIQGENCRSLRINGEVIHALHQCLQVHTSTSLQRNAWIFAGDDGQRMSMSTVDSIVRKLGWQLGIVVSAQVLRNTCIRMLLQQCRDKRVVADYVGLRSTHLVKLYGESGRDEAVPFGNTLSLKNS